MVVMSLGAKAGVSISSPSAGATVSSPVRVVATASSTRTVNHMKIYVDYKAVYAVNAAKIDTSVAMSLGSHLLVIQAWDSAGTVMKQSMTIKVGSTSSTTSPPKKIFYDIEQMSGWKSCDVCAGINAAGPTVYETMTRGISSPSMDGNSSRFSIAGTNSYANALFYKQLGGYNATRFTYDVYFYLKTPTAAQGLEFDVSQNIGGKRYVFGTQCDILDKKTWDVWDTKNGKWVPTGIACVRPEAYRWHHLVWEFEITSDKRARFISMTLNGKKYYINRYHYPKATEWYMLTPAFQMNGNKYLTDYSVWLDNVKLSIW
jgi:hypothetical protein